jgi:maltose alpha-D-glucosyltransferase/alpha-amylase
MPAVQRNREGLDPDPFWYKSGVFYEVHVRAFYDADGDGTGDFRGLTEKLDYLKDLGVTAVWLLPFYPSPLRDDGYDIADYYGVHPMYGTLTDFRVFLREAHRRGLRVITELVLNHTSDQHAWFQRSRRARPGSRWRNFYVWSDDTRRYQNTRVIFKDVEASNWTWDPVAKAHFWHRFFSHQPDLNYENPEVHEAMFKVVDFWLDLGVDGLRLDAVPYLYEQEGTSCENLPETHAFLKALRAHVDREYRDRMLLAEANQWPEDAAAYFGQGQGDECHMAFHFPLMPRLFMALRMEDRLPIVDILEQTPPIPETGQWALFLRNHDELTLEMVTDEERDYMYRMYAQVHQARLNLGIRRRLAPLLGNDRKSIELLNALLFSLPGTPVLYYGDEIGLGENIYLGDRNGVRTPMQWSPDKNAGFSRANPQSLYLPIILDPAYHYEANNVETQLDNPHSLLWWMRRLLALRKRWRALGEGRCEFLQPDNRKILSYILHHDRETLLVVANLSRFSQPVELELSAYSGKVPVELFGRTAFPVISEHPYLLSLGPHVFYWFSIEPKAVPSPGPAPAAAGGPIPALAVADGWQEALADKTKIGLEMLLPDYLRRQPWFSAADRAIKSVAIRESVPIAIGGDDWAFLNSVAVDYLQGDSETYVLPLTFAVGEEAERLRKSSERSIVARLTLPGSAVEGVLYDAMESPAFCRALLGHISQRRRVQGPHGQLEALRLAGLRTVLGDTDPQPVATQYPQRHTSVVFGDRVILKLFRRLQAGTNPELDFGRFLIAREFSRSPPLVGALEYVGEDETRYSLAVAHGFVAGAKNAWDYTLDALGRYFDRVITWAAKDLAAPLPPPESVNLLHLELPGAVAESLGTYVESARMLGQLTAELHRTLAQGGEDPAFEPEPFTPHYQRGVLQSMRNLAVQNLRLLRRQLKTLPADLLPLARRVSELEPMVLQNYRQVFGQPIAAKRIRIHGDYRLSQVLWTGRDFVIVDFEGDPSLAISERCLKRSPLRDVASMVRSFHYAAYAGLWQHVEGGSIPQENLHNFEPWVRLWNLWVSVAFLNAYFLALDKSGLLPEQEPALRALLQAYLLHQVLAELGNELGPRGTRLRVPLQGILYLTGQPIPPTDSPA